MSCLPVHGQMLAVTFETQAQMSTKSGDVSACGVSFSAVHVDGPYAQGLSGSINLYLDGVAGIKAGLFDFSSTGNPQNPFKRAPSAFRLAWVRADGGKPVSPQKPEHMIPSDDDGYRLFAVPLKPGADLLIRVAGGEKLWLGFKSDKGHERIFNGPLKWEAGAEAQFRECLDLLSGAVAQQMKANPK